MQAREKNEGGLSRGTARKLFLALVLPCCFSRSLFIARSRYFITSNPPLVKKFLAAIFTLSLSTLVICDQALPVV